MLCAVTLCTVTLCTVTPCMVTPNVITLYAITPCGLWVIILISLVHKFGLHVSCFYTDNVRSPLNHC